IYDLWGDTVRLARETQRQGARTILVTLAVVRLGSEVGPFVPPPPPEAPAPRASAAGAWSISTRWPGTPHEPAPRRSRRAVGVGGRARGVVPGGIARAQRAGVRVGAPPSGARVVGAVRSHLGAVGAGPGALPAQRPRAARRRPVRPPGA